MNDNEHFSSSMGQIRSEKIGNDFRLVFLRLMVTVGRIRGRKTMIFRLLHLQRLLEFRHDVVRRMYRPMGRTVNGRERLN